MRRLARILLYAAVVAAVMLSSPPAGHSARPWAWRETVATAGGRGSWVVTWTVRRCPHGALCKRWSELEPNYGQALKRSRELELEGFTVVSLAQVAP